MDKIVKFIVEGHWGDIASVGGLFISVVGFIFTIWGVMRSRQAAERAELAALETKKVLVRSDAISDLSGAVKVMEEIKRLQRLGGAAWPIALDRISSVTTVLVQVHGGNPGWPEEFRAHLQGAIGQLRGIEETVERALEKDGGGPSKAAKLNEIVSAQMDKVNGILAIIKQETEVEKHPKSLGQAGLERHS